MKFVAGGGLRIDPGERYMVPARIDYVRQIVRQADAFLPSEMEIRSLFGEEMGYLAAAQTLCDWGAKLVAVKNDPVQAAQMGLVSASIIIEGYGALYGLTRSSNETVNRLKTMRKQTRD